MKNAELRAGLSFSVVAALAERLDGALPLTVDLWDLGRRREREQHHRESGPYNSELLDHRHR
jgi:hypothetical protein